MIFSMRPFSCFSMIFHPGKFSSLHFILDFVNHGNHWEKTGFVESFLRSIKNFPNGNPCLWILTSPKRFCEPTGGILFDNPYYCPLWDSFGHCSIHAKARLTHNGVAWNLLRTPWGIGKFHAKGRQTGTIFIFRYANIFLDMVHGIVV